MEETVIERSPPECLSALQVHSLRGVGGGKICRGIDKFLLTHAKFESLWKNHWASGYIDFWDLRSKDLV